MITGRLYREAQPKGEPLDLDRADAWIRGNGGFAWVDVTDPDPTDLGYLERTFGLHPVTLEDAQHRHQRTKVELFEGYAFVVLRPVTMVEGTATPTEHEIHAIAGEGFLVTVRWTPALPAGCRDDTVAATRGPPQRGFRPLRAARRGRRRLPYRDRGARGRGGRTRGRGLRARRRAPNAARGAGAPVPPEAIDRAAPTHRPMPLRHGIDLLQEEPAFSSSALAPYFRDVMDHVIRVVGAGRQRARPADLAARGSRGSGGEPAERGDEEAHARGPRSCSCRR